MNSPSLFESKAVIQLTLREPVDLSPFYFNRPEVAFEPEHYKFTEKNMVELLGPYLGNSGVIRDHVFSMVVPQPDGTIIHLGKVNVYEGNFVFTELEAS